jgi:hypothetical protein
MNDFAILALLVIVFRETDFATFALLWFGCGLVLSVYWPLRYIRLMSPASWKAFAFGWPVYGLLGPLAFFAANVFEH